MTITVLIATYNRAPMLARCLAGFEGQSFQPGDEIVVADNGSSDDTAAVVRECAARLTTPVRYVVESAAGKSRALAAGLRVSRGDVLALTDDDVIVSHGWLATIRQLWRELNPGLVGGRVQPLWERPAPRWLRSRGDHGYGALCAPLALLDYGPRRAPLGARTALGANMAVSRRALESAGGFPLELGKLRGTLLSGEDHQVCERVQSAGFAAFYDPELVVQHHVPAARLRFTYHLRWFFWSGITNAALDSAGPHAKRVRAAHWAARASRGGLRAAAAVLRGHLDSAAEAAVDVAFALGYLARSHRWMTARAATTRTRGAAHGMEAL